MLAAVAFAVLPVRIKELVYRKELSNMKKSIIIPLAAVLCLSLLAGCNAKDSSTPPNSKQAKNRVSKRQFLNVAVDCSTRHIKTFCQLAYLYMPPDAKQFKNLPPAPSGLHGLSPPPSFCSGLSILQNAEKRLPLFPNT